VQDRGMNASLHVYGPIPSPAHRIIIALEVSAPPRLIEALQPEPHAACQVGALVNEPCIVADSGERWIPPPPTAEEVQRQRDAQAAVQASLAAKAQDDAQRRFQALQRCINNPPRNTWGIRTMPEKVWNARCQNQNAAQ
jgi:hypothetical protein